MPISTRFVPTAGLAAGLAAALASPAVPARAPPPGGVALAGADAGGAGVVAGGGVVLAADAGVDPVDAGSAAPVDVETPAGFVDTTGSAAAGVPGEYIRTAPIAATRTTAPIPAGTSHPRDF